MPQNQITEAHRAIYAHIYAVLSTAYEAGPVPESTVYIAMGMNLGKCQDIIGLMVASDLITVRHHLIELTSKGRQVAEECQKAMAGPPKSMTWEDLESKHKTPLAQIAQDVYDDLSATVEELKTEFTPEQADKYITEHLI